MRLSSPHGLKPFTLAGSLSYCPECGATGDYELIKHAAQVVGDKFNRFEASFKRQEPFPRELFLDLKSSIGVLTSVIDMKAR